MIKKKIENIIVKTQESELIRGKWFTKLNEIDNEVYKCEEYGELYNYNFPFRNAAFIIERPETYDFPIIKLITDKNKIVIDRNNETKKESFINIEKLEQIFKEEHLSFAPAYTKEFKDAITDINVGEKVSLNSGMELVCIKKEQDESVFKSTYTGNIFNINIENFRKSEIFKINNNDDSSIQKLFCEAYDRNCSTLNIRVRLNNNDGIKKVKEIENKLNNGNTKQINIGNLKLNVLKHDNKCHWYGPDGKLLQNKEPEIIFSWAYNSNAIIESFIGEDNSIYKRDVLTEKEIQILNNAAFSTSGNNFIDEAFKIAENKPVFIGTTGLELEGDNFNLISYVFFTNNNERKILKCTFNEDNTFPDRIENINIKDFLSFYTQKYQENIRKVKNIYYNKIPDISEKEKVLNIIANEHFKKNNTNPIEISMNNVKQETIALLNKYIETGIEDDFDLLK